MAAADEDDEDLFSNYAVVCEVDKAERSPEGPAGPDDSDDDEPRRGGKRKKTRVSHKAKVAKKAAPELLTLDSDDEADGGGRAKAAAASPSRAHGKPGAGRGRAVGQKGGMDLIDLEDEDATPAGPPPPAPVLDPHVQAVLLASQQMLAKLQAPPPADDDDAAAGDDEVVVEGEKAADKGAKEAKPPLLEAPAVVVQLRVQMDGLKPRTFKTFANKPLSVLMDSFRDWAAKKLKRAGGVAPALELTFRFDGTKLRPQDTPAGRGMEDEDVIDAAES